MSRILRFLLYTDPSRKSTVQVGQDEAATDFPDYPHGSHVEIEGRRYVVAHLTKIKLTPRATDPDRMDAEYQVFLAPIEDRLLYDEPELIRR